MRGVGGAVEFLTVTAVARGRNGCVVIVHVALVARRGRVRACERETRFRMVEGRRAPSAGGVALRAVLRESACNVVGIGRRTVVLLMARITIAWRTCVLIIQMALGTSQRCVHPRQRISGVSGVIEFGVLPVGGGMAHAAVVREIGILVRRIGGSRPICLVAGVACRRRAFELVVGVAGRTLERGVHAGQRITGHRQVVELGSKPVIDRVA